VPEPEPQPQPIGAEAASQSGLDSRQRIGLTIHTAIVWLASFVFVPLIATTMWLGRGWRIRDMDRVRRSFRQGLRDHPGPLLICANHLTLVDSPIIAWGLASPWWYFAHPSTLAWNVPERMNFARGMLARALVYILKCIPVTRGGNRAAVSHTLDQLAYVLSKGETALMFPEAGRGRTGRVDTAGAAYGVGRLVKNVPGIHVLCVYLRGDHQETYSDYPVRGESFHLELSWLEPQTEHRGLRGSVDISRQILRRIADMEQEYFDGRQ
jgi:1-acyl-sn-glycerol-3-phosphate acyltransferase